MSTFSNKFKNRKHEFDEIFQHPAHFVKGASFDSPPCQEFGLKPNKKYVNPSKTRTSLNEPA